MNRLAPLLPLALVAAVGCQPSGPPKPPADLAPAALEAKGPGMHKLQAQAPTGKTVKYAILVPADLTKDGKVPLVVALHFAGKDSDWYGAGMIDSLYRDGCRELGAVIVAPDSLTGDDWDNQTNVDHVVWLTKSVMKAYPIDEKKVVLSGFSAGGIGTWYIAPRAGGLFTAAIPVAGEPKLSGADWTVPVCAVHSESDTILRAAATTKAIDKLKAEGKPAHMILLKDGTTHYQSGKYVRPLQEACTWIRGNWK